LAVVRRGGEALRSAEGLSPGDRLDITLADGEVQAAVVACTKKKR
ncbi:MAG TPA: exodeoxyribonuclease VII large subunit, partial [Alistipes obesi]|nr:exodeoxyribonuclease VII large subunit [Alistipes communis]